MQISISKSKSDKAFDHNLFDVVDVKGVAQFCDLITHHHWSPIVWKDNKRLSANFQTARLCVLDFDDGRMSVDAAVEKIKELGYFHVVGTTKSHQLRKGNLPAVDRFRVIFKWESEICDARTFKHNMQKLASYWPCDRQALDAARKYAPCRDIVSVGDGRAVLISQAPPPKENWIRPGYFTSEKQVPNWIKELLTQGLAEGSRNATLYRVCKNLQKYGFAENETRVLIEASNIKMAKHEVDTVIRSAYR